MIWLFERGDNVIRLTTRFDRTSGEYTIVIVRPEGDTTTERYKDLTAFHSRVLALQREFDSEGWHQSGSPTLISDDWRGPLT